MALEGDDVEVLTGGYGVLWGVYHAGTFDLEVTAEGYEPVVVTNIWIPAERYMQQDYVPVNVVVRLVPVAQDNNPSGL